MAWSRFDDDYDENPKIAALSHPAFRLHAYSITYSTRNRTRGYLSQAAVRVLLAKVEGAGPRHISELTSARCWERVEGGYAVHDYAVYHPKDPTAAERMQRFRHQGHRNDTRNVTRNDNRNANRNGYGVENRNASGSGTLPEPEPDNPPLSPLRNAPLQDTPDPDPGEMEIGESEGAPPNPNRGRTWTEDEWRDASLAYVASRCHNFDDPNERAKVFQEFKTANPPPWDKEPA